MIINKIKLVNFKNFDTVEVNLNQMNVIVGANASGKSNFIQALKFLRDIKDFGIENALSLHGGVEYFKNLLLKNKKKTIIKIDFPSPKHYEIFSSSSNVIERVLIVKTNYAYSIEISVHKHHKNDYEIKEQLLASNELYARDFKEAPPLYKFDFKYIVENGQSISTNSFQSDLIWLTLPNGEKACIHTKILEHPINYDKNEGTLLKQITYMLPAEEIVIYDFDLKKAKSSTPITGKADLEENGENLAIVLRNILKDKEKSRQFSNLMKDMLPFIKQLDIDKFYDKSLLFKVKEIYNHNAFIPSALLSDGTISVTAIVVALFFQNKHLAIFEEPEHGLHPALIAQLMQLFYAAAENKQIIVTTHNPEVLKYTRLEDLLLVSRNEKGFAIITKPAEQTMVKAFLENELGIDQLFIQNLLDA